MAKSKQTQFLELGDYVKYKLVLKNTTEDTYELGSLVTDADSAAAYTIESADGENSIAPGGAKEVYLTIKYENKVDDSDYDNDTYTNSDSATISLTKNEPAPEPEPEPQPQPEPEPEVEPEPIPVPSDETVPSPNTFIDSPAMSILLLSAFIVIAYVLYRKNGKARFMIVALLLMTSFVSLKAYCTCACSIEIESKITIPKFKNREINNVVMDKPIIDDEHSDYMEPVTGVNFLEPSSDANGKGVYVFAPTKNDETPVYYYRGAVDNNNLIFADFCWKIFRTTETEGLKIMYNGVPTNGQCLAEGDDTMIATGVKYNSAVNNLSFYGYSYAPNGHTFNYMSNSRVTNGMIFANDVSYVDGHYILNDDQYVKDGNFASERDGVLKTHHYMCFSVGATECETVRYIYMTRSVNMFYVTLKNGEKIEDVIRNEVTDSANTTKSIVRTTVDDWYEQNMTAYTDKLEDTVWCNDRSLYEIGGWSKDNDVLEIANEQDGKLTFSANYRVFTLGKPSIDCANKNDAFTVSEENGNGDLDYPIGLMTLDEAVMAGFNWYKYDDSSDNYLNNGKGWWLMSPSLLSANNIYVGVAYSRVDHVTPVYNTNGLGGVRPMVSLKKGFTIKSGNGTISDPFILND